MGGRRVATGSEYAGKTKEERKTDEKKGQRRTKRRNGDERIQKKWGKKKWPRNRMKRVERGPKEERRAEGKTKEE